jgi:DNA-binding LacI/PurR family transcriptional regulator
MTTMNDIAQAAGVSKSTVSNVFSQKRPISKEVRNRVLEVAKQLNYKPNYWARSLVVKQTKIIGLNMPAENVKFSQFHMSLINGVLSECYKQGYRLLVNTLSEKYRNQVEYQTSDPVDGEILLDPSVDDPRITEGLEKNKAMVVIGKPPCQFEDQLSYVDNNNVSAAYQITKKLTDLGHKKILFLNAPKHRTVSHDRSEGYIIAMRSAGITVNPEWIIPKDENLTSIEFGYEKTREMLKKGKGITAIITDTDKMALGVYRATKELNYSIPKDLSIVAFSDNPIFTTEFSLPLTCMQLDGEKLGVEAANLLIEQLQSQNTTIKRVVVPIVLNERGSCAKPKK